MDDIAEHLSQRWRVLCPDTIGRGLSQWSREPEREYCLAFYVRLAVALLDQLGIERCHWIGTSMGGAIGTLAAAGPLRGRIRRLILNDNGPQLAPAAIERIRAYAGTPAAFDTVSELEQYFRSVYKPYGRMSDAQWRRLTETSVRRLPDGRVTPHYDPAMVTQFTHHDDDYDLWEPGTRSTCRCCACAASTPTCCCARRPTRCASAARARWWSRCRLRPCAGAEHARAVRPGRALLRGVNGNSLQRREAE